MAKKVSPSELSRHNIPEDLWIVVDGTVYDMTDFAPRHPGGAEGASRINLSKTILNPAPLPPFSPTCS